MEQEQVWIKTDVSIDTVNWHGEPVHLTGVTALKNSKTGEIRVFPFEVAKAEVKQITESLGICPQDAEILLMIFARPGYFKQGEVFYKYHLQKLLFYLWKTLEKQGYGEALPIDSFIAAKNGPKPEHLENDLERLEKAKLITIRSEKWEEGVSKRITLTREGTKIAETLWESLAAPYKEIAIRVKERIHPLTPDRVRHLVHNEYPEYRNTYVENDIE